MSEKKERPILFSTPMVQAILNGTKTQTRRIIKDKFLYAGEPKFSTRNHQITNQCPYGKVGDILWVRETFAKIDENRFIYKANENQKAMRWKPSIHMPKKAAQIFLEITEIKVERLQDISEEDAKAEGVSCGIFRNGPKVGETHLELNDHGSYYGGFKHIWHYINGVYSWNANPWVWVVKFKVIKP